MAPVFENPWFMSLPERERDALLAAAAPQSLGRGAILFRKGERTADTAADGFYCVVSGCLKASSLHENGRESILTLIEPGHWFGELTLVDPAGRSHDITAVVDTDVLVVRNEAFERLMESPVFVRAIARLLALRLRMVFSALDDGALCSTSMRIVRRLVMLAHGDANALPSGRTRLPVSQDALAMMLGISRQTLNKELRSLAEADLVRVGYRHIDIPCLDRLLAFG